jgi:thioredoxin-like negative regulator of GroEL
LLKINIDKFGRIAQTFQIKAVPTVYIVVEGKAVDAFSGELTDEQLDKFLETAGRASQGSQEQEKVGLGLEQAKAQLNSKDYAGAEQTLLEIKYNKVPEEYKLVGDIFLACAYSEQNKLAQLRSLVEVMKTNAIFYQDKP